MHCQVTNCNRPKDGRSHFCRNHKRNKIRHGHPTQESLSSHELAPHLRSVQARIKKNFDNPVWVQVEYHWLAVVKKAQEYVEASQQGQAQVLYQREAWSYLARIGTNVEARAVMEVAFAMYLLRGWNPRRFKDDRAFGFQLVRRIRMLDYMAVGVTWDEKTKQNKRVYRDMKPKTTAIMAEMLLHTFRDAGMAVARLEVEERDRKQAEANQFYEHIKALK
jgi:hypothetical protein